MLTRVAVRPAVTRELTALLAEDLGEHREIRGGDQLYDLGMHSLTLARLVATLEEVVGVDPFAAEDVSVADLRSLDDVVAVYERAVARVEPVGAGVSGR
jgi:acyl carrier protein